MPDTFADDFKAAVDGLHAADAHSDYLVISTGISRGLHRDLSTLVCKRPPKDAVTVFLTTDGGDPNGGYRVARCLRHHYKKVRLAVPSYCKSAGTLIAIAADELGIGDLGELGPLDIQVRKGSELQEQSSGLDIMQALQAVTSYTQDAFHRLLVGTRSLGLSTKICAEFAATVAAGVAAPLLAQIDPIRLGEMQRATRIAYEYGTRLDAYTKNLKPGALERLVGEYPAHGFVIDRKEAKELFHRVSNLTPQEAKLCDVLWHCVVNQGDFAPTFLDQTPDQTTNGTEDDGTHDQGNAEAPGQTDG
ncbi:SDH family Clp fold serine proteinase [Dokdonella immobilis]|uniref:Serine dehydrogenase proteinase n=1 Tax=Dokdonella immobilis TaxID=578942 RepID=A0A1I4ZTV8_9GAMM|nr:hypothetical protein [Dokdonella immobilis]SFN53716.1 Serine dehydrogenase proteinase [Dokdonella immobilis]